MLRIHSRYVITSYSIHYTKLYDASRRYVPGGETDSPVADWIPAVDVIEQKDCFVLRADLPGVRPEDIDVRMEKGVLSLSGERRAESDQEVDGMRRIERYSYNCV